MADPTAEQLERLAAQWPVNTTTDNNRVASEVEVLMLAVKPQVMKPVTEALSDAVQASRALVISIAAGIPVASLERWLGRRYCGGTLYAQYSGAGTDRCQRLVRQCLMSAMHSASRPNG